MNRKEANDNVTDLINTLPSKDKITFLSIFPNSGFTYSLKFSTIRIEIGMNGYSYYNALNFLNKVEDFMVACSSLSVLHENSHFEEYESFKRNDFSVIDLKSHIISTENRFLYKQEYQYFPHEIYAEHRAFLDLINYNIKNDIFKIEDLDKATKQRKEFALSQKGQCFTDKETFQEAIDDLSKKYKNPVGFFEYSLPPKSERELPTGEVEKYYEDALMNYLSEHENSVIWKMRVDTMTYYIPLDFIFAISVEYGKKPEAQIVKDRIGDPAYPIKENEINPAHFESFWLEKLNKDPKLIERQYKTDRPEKAPNNQPEPTSGLR